MKDALYLAYRYLAYHRIKTAILVTSISLIVFLPVGLRVLVSQSEEQLTSRAAATPLIVGAKGSPLELVLNSLYFEGDVPERMRYQEVTRIDTTGLALAIPWASPDSVDRLVLRLLPPGFLSLSPMGVRSFRCSAAE